MYAAIKEKQRQDFEDRFRRKAFVMHDNNLDLSGMVYKGMRTPVHVRCIAHDTVFAATPYSISAGDTKCPQCQPRELSYSTGKAFSEAASHIHGERYDYSMTVSQTDPIRSTSMLDIICRTHEVFRQTAYFHLRGHGCASCNRNASGRRRAYTTDEWVRIAQSKFGDQDYDYTSVSYFNAYTDVTIICKKHGPFRQRPTNHLYGKNGCSACVHEKLTRTTQDFVRIALQVHGGKYSYDKVIYQTCDGHVIVTCKIHGDFPQIAWCHLAGHGCAKCFMIRHYSAISIGWLQYMAVCFGCDVQHAENGGEYIFPENRRMTADGFIASTKTVLEFHGDYFHGNPDVFASESMNKALGRTHGSLYDRTKRRESQILQWGYRLYTVWERDWKAGIKAVTVIQRKWREYIRRQRGVEQ